MKSLSRTLPVLHLITLLGRHIEHSWPKETLHHIQPYIHNYLERIPAITLHCCDNKHDYTSSDISTPAGSYHFRSVYVCSGAISSQHISSYIHTLHVSTVVTAFPTLNMTEKPHPIIGCPIIRCTCVEITNSCRNYPILLLESAHVIQTPTYCLPCLEPLAACDGDSILNNLLHGLHGQTFDTEPWDCLLKLYINLQDELNTESEGQKIAGHSAIQGDTHIHRMEQEIVRSTRQR